MLYRRQMTARGWWHRPLIPATQEAKAPLPQHFTTLRTLKRTGKQWSVLRNGCRRMGETGRFKPPFQGVPASFLLPVKTTPLVLAVGYLIFRW